MSDEAKRKADALVMGMFAIAVPSAVIKVYIHPIAGFGFYLICLGALVESETTPAPAENVTRRREF